MWLAVFLLATYSLHFLSPMISYYVIKITCIEHQRMMKDEWFRDRWTNKKRNIKYSTGCGMCVFAFFVEPHCTHQPHILWESILRDFVLTDQSFTNNDKFITVHNKYFKNEINW